MLLRDLSLVISSILIGIDKGGIPGVGSLGIALSVLFSSETKHIIAMFTPVLFCSDLYISIVMRNKVEWNYVKSLAPSFLVGLLLGFMLIKIFTDSIVRKIAGYGLVILATIHCIVKYGSRFSLLPSTNKTISIAHILQLHKLHDIKDNHSTIVTYIVGLASGLLSVVANVAGPLIAIYLITSKISTLTINSTRAWIFTLANLIKIPMHMFNSNLVYNDIPLITFLISVSLASTYTTEKYILPRINNKILELLCWILILIAALVCLYD